MMLINYRPISLFASNLFEANIANTLWAKRTAFTRSAIVAAVD